MLSTSISVYAPIGQIISRHRDREEVFSPLRGENIHLPKVENVALFMSPSSPLQTATISREILTIFAPDQQAISQHHSLHLHRSKKRPLLVSKRTSTTHPIVPVLLTRVSSTGQLADQYWSHSPLNRSEAASSNSRPSPIRIYTTRPALDQAITARGVYRKKGKEARS